MGENSNMSEQQPETFIKVKNESGSESTHYSVIYEGFPDEFKLIAEKELNETEENRKRGLQKLKEYSKSKHSTVLEDHILLAMLRSCKYNLKKSQAKLENFVAKRREMIAMLAEIGKDKIESILDDFPFGILPYRDKHGRAILYTRPYGVNLERYEMLEVGVVGCLSVLFLMKFPISSVAGFTYFGECKAPNCQIFYPIFQTFRQLMFHVLSFPLRIGRIEIFNENVLCRCFHKVMSSILSKKLVSRISLHGPGYEKLHKLYHPDILPEEFGGTMGPLTNTFYKQEFLDFLQELINETI